MDKTDSRNAYYDKGGYDKVITDCTQAITLNPNYAMAYFKRGLAYAEKGDYDHAIIDYSKAITLDPNGAEAYLNRGIAYGNKGDYDLAIADYTQSIKLEPNSATAYGERGLAYHQKGDYDHAIADCNQSIKLTPNNAWVYNNLGNAYDDKGEFERAIASYTQAINLPPCYAPAYRNRGIAYYRKEDYAKARADFLKSLEIEPDNENAHKWVDMLNKLVKAVTMWEYKGTGDVFVGEGHGILEYDFFAVNGEEEVSSLVDFYAGLWRRFDYFFGHYEALENNTGLSPNVKTAMAEHNANLCVTFKGEEHKENNINIRTMIVNIKLADGAYNFYAYNFYHLNEKSRKLFEELNTKINDEMHLAEGGE